MTLWCVHVQGPDTLIAQPSKAIAEQRAERWNRELDEMRSKAVPQPPPIAEWDERGQASPAPAPEHRIIFKVTRWPWTAAAHAAELHKHGGDPEEVC